MFLLDAHAAEHAHHHGALQEFFVSLFCKLFGVEDGNPLAEIPAHFLYDLLRTFVIFLVVLTIVSFLKTYIPVASVRRALLKVNRYVAIVIAAFAGILSSTCICTNVPLFLGFLAFGIPVHLAMTYLVAASMINITSLLSMAAITDLRFTAVYIAVCLLMTIVTGIILSFIDGEKYVYRDRLSAGALDPAQKPSFSERWHYALHETKHTLRDQWIYIVIGVAISALINGFVNLEFAEKISGFGFWGVLGVTIVGLVLHTDVVSVLPVVSALLRVDVPYGMLIALVTSLAFFSIPMVIMVKKTVSLRYIAYSWVVMFVLILISGQVLLVLQ